jgi:hypothetical protein
VAYTNRCTGAATDEPAGRLWRSALARAAWAEEDEAVEYALRVVPGLGVRRAPEGHDRVETAPAITKDDESFLDASAWHATRTLRSNLANRQCLRSRPELRCRPTSALLERHERVARSKVPQRACRKLGAARATRPQPPSPEREDLLRVREVRGEGLGGPMPSARITHAVAGSRVAIDHPLRGCARALRLALVVASKRAARGRPGSRAADHGKYPCPLHPCARRSSHARGPVGNGTPGPETNKQASGMGRGGFEPPTDGL